MKRIITVLSIMFCLSVPNAHAATPIVETMLTKVAHDIDTAPKGSTTLKVFVKKNLISLCTTPALIDAAKAHNAKHLSLAEIQKIDIEWIEAEEPLPIMESLLKNPCGKALQNLAYNLTPVSKGFAFDNQGATVGAHRIPNDYWQGDEGKYRRTVKDQSIEIGPIKFDKAENTQLQHVALPLIDTDGTVVGGVLIGIFLDKL